MYHEKNLEEKEDTQPTSIASSPESIPGHDGGRRALSLLRQPCSLKANSIP